MARTHLAPRCTVVVVHRGGVEGESGPRGVVWSQVRALKKTNLVHTVDRTSCVVHKLLSYNTVPVLYNSRGVFFLGVLGRGFIKKK